MNPDQLRRALRDAGFPASKEDLVQVAQSAGASGEVEAMVKPGEAAVSKRH